MLTCACCVNSASIVFFFFFFSFFLFFFFFFQAEDGIRDYKVTGVQTCALPIYLDLDVVINNAGTTVSKSALNHSGTEIDTIIDTNLKGVFHVAKAAAASMVARDIEGSIINVASILGHRVAGHASAYAASKAAVLQLTRALALEWARYGVRVNALSPGYIETELNRDFFASEAGKALIRRVPQRKLGQPEDLDGPILLLASDLGRFMTGADIAVDGGHLVSSL